MSDWHGSGVGEGGHSVKVLYVAGSGRSGSTLLDNILGQVPGLVSAGELRFLWERGMLEDRLCGCGKPFSECDQWRGVIKTAYGSLSLVDAREAVASQATQTRVRNIPRLIWNRRRQVATPPPAAHANRLHRLYRAIAAETGADIIVDSSKLPAYGYLLQRLSGIDLYVVHLVRDPRAAAYSWLRRKVQPDRKTAGYMNPQGIVRSSLLWTVWNTAAAILWAGQPDRYMVLRYEDLVATPQAVIQRVLEFAGVPDPQLPFVGEYTVELQGNHTVAGNPNRLTHGQVTIRGDDEWETAMPASKRRLVTALTAPVLHHFGYRLATAGRAAKM